MLTRILRASPLKHTEEEGPWRRDDKRHWIWDLVMRTSYKSHGILQKPYNLIYDSQLSFSHCVWPHDEFLIPKFVATYPLPFVRWSRPHSRDPGLEKKKSRIHKAIDSSRGQMRNLYHEGLRQSGTHIIIPPSPSSLHTSFQVLFRVSEGSKGKQWGLHDESEM